MSTVRTSPRSRRSPRRRWAAWCKDAVAALINAVVSVPDGLASAALTGVNPVYGLYTSVAAPIGGSLLTSAQLMHRDDQRVGAGRGGAGRGPRHC